MFLLAASFWFALTTVGVADERFTLRGIGTGNPRISVALSEGSELTPCSRVHEALFRCILVDANQSEAILNGIAEQIEAQGLVATQPPRPGAAPGLRYFAPVESAVRCPHVVMIVPNAEDRFAAAPPPEGRLFYVVSYSYDVLCIAEAAPR